MSTTTIHKNAERAKQEDDDKRKIAIVGDAVTDILLPDESRVPLLLGKETLYSGSIPDQDAFRGVGGVVYLQQLVKLLFRTHHPEVIQAESLEEEAKCEDEGESLAGKTLNK